MKQISGVRRWMLALLTFGLLGTIAELLLLDHYEEVLQFIPIVLVVFALAVVLWRGLRPSGTSSGVLRVTMMLFVAAGILGVVLHFRGAAQFQREIDPSQRAWEIFKKAMRAKDPPVLAPGLMLQLGLIGLLYDSISKTE
jgi:hypothetical protein